MVRISNLVKKRYTKATHKINSAYIIEQKVEKKNFASYNHHYIIKPYPLNTEIKSSNCYCLLMGVSWWLAHYNVRN